MRFGWVVPVGGVGEPRSVRRGAAILGQTLDQRYKIVSKIGAGGLATVYLGRDLKLGRPVAVKVLRPDRADANALARLRSEVEFQAKLDDSRIVRLYDVGLKPSPYLVREFIAGADFGAVLRQASMAERLFVLSQVAGGLEVLHAHNLVHRDLKPTNIGSPPFVLKTNS